MKKQINAQSVEDFNRGQAIMLAIEIASSFKLYSYHIIAPEQFQARVNDLINNYLNSTSKIRTK